MAFFYKLLKNDIGGNFGLLIRNMYSKAEVAVRLQGGLTDYFNTTIGVKQGCVLSPTLFKLFVNDMPDIFGPGCHPATLYLESINCLLFADDVILVSESEDGLQVALDNLMKYCNDWMLEINPDKTKVMIFNKSGKKLSSYKFKIKNQDLEVADSSTYLGITFNANGSLKNAITNLCKKAMKAMFKLRSAVFNTNMNPKTALFLFDSLIRPIATYGSEVWGAFLNDIPDMFNINSSKLNTDNMSFEKLDLKFCKYILGVHRKASNLGSRGELGRFPISLHITKMMIKYWLRMTDYNKNTLLYDAYLCNLELLGDNKNCWLKNIHDIIRNKLGAKHLWENQGTSGENIKQITPLYNKLKYIYEFQWANAKNKNENKNNEGNKLRTYNKFKKQFNYEAYLDFEPDFRKRRNITRLRISAHHLEIETGRYKMKNGKKIPPDERLCKTCNAVEDEYHLIMNCKTHDKERSELLDKVNETFPDFPNIDDKEKFLFLMSCNDYELYMYVRKFMDEVVHKRGTI